ncbi:hypothetical protein [Ornithinimicrobium murale]|uniref:hypothetical protein n=1 Tax=Ornithinimicrobium murale TaxID=1050153 RepID=UPI0013B4093A|nr:hypothetical protein [Ornithinimicrobium murale]
MSTKTKARKHRGIANPGYAQGMAELRRSNAAGTHGDRRTKRARDRGARRRLAISDQDR